MAERSGHTEFQPPDKEQRNKYLYAIARLYEDLMEPEHFRALIGLDLIQTSTDGETFTSEYEHNIKFGHVDKMIANIKLPFSRE